MLGNQKMTHDDNKSFQTFLTVTLRNAFCSTHKTHLLLSHGWCTKIHIDYNANDIHRVCSAQPAHLYLAALWASHFVLFPWIQFLTNVHCKSLN